MPARSYSSRIQPAPTPSSKRPPDSRSRVAASLSSTIVPSRRVRVTPAAAISATVGASWSPKGSGTKWSRSSSVA
jgi:hypothetical protein